MTTIKYSVKRDDEVQVLAGRDRGKQGKILEMLPKVGRARVQGVNMVKRHMKKTQSQPGQIVEKELPIHVSNLMLICKSCGRPTRTGHSFLGDGSKVRVCKKCGEQT
jgi:large subunit ribosomal protein L24